MQQREIPVHSESKSFSNSVLKLCALLATASSANIMVTSYLNFIVVRLLITVLFSESHYRNTACKPL